MGFENLKLWLQQQPKKKFYLIGGAAAGIFTLVIFGCCGLMSVAFFMQKSNEKEVAQAVTDANALWTAGKKDEAAKKYKAIIKDGVSDIEKENRPTVFQRVIEYDVENGDTSSAKEYVEKAALFNVALSFDNPNAAKLLAEVEAKKRVEKYASARKEVADEELKEMSLDQIWGRLGTHDEVYHTPGTANASLYIWKVGEDDFIVVSTIKRIDGGPPTVVVAKTKRTRQVVEQMKKATAKF